jgi:hypothetical protein
MQGVAGVLQAVCDQREQKQEVKAVVLNEASFENYLSSGMLKKGTEHLNFKN